MAAYAATVSLMHILDLIKNHPSPPISLDKQQFHSLAEIVTFLQKFLEGYVSPFSCRDEADPLEMRIADAAHAAEDVIESCIVDNIHLAAAATATKHYAMESYVVDSIKLEAEAAHDEDKQIHYFNLYEGLQKVIEAMDLIKKEVMEMEMEKVREKGGLLEAKLQRNVSVEAEGKIEMVGFDDARLELLDRLIGQDSNRQIIPVVGMGGIGKTTLAQNVFDDQLVKKHFDICVWVTVSQDYNIEKTLREILSKGRGHSSGESVTRLGEELHKYLYGRRYLVVMDDMWSIEVWDKIRFFFPNCGEGSRILVTTRMSNLAAHLSNSKNILCMSFLSEVDSWTLFSKIAFGSEGSVLDLQLQLKLREIGKKIVGKCKGLPLSIVVIGGLLAKSESTQAYWEYIEKNLNSIVNLENEEYCLRILKLSYNHLPAYLKPCFLYMGVFDEDHEIKVSTIIKLWVSEGFVKPRKNKNLERVAREYFQELVDRNLILVDDEAGWSLSYSSFMYRELGSIGMAMLCRMHDLVRDVSLREARKQRFYYVYNKQHDPSSDCHRCIVIPDKTIGHVYPREVIPPKAFESSPSLRSYVCHDDYVDLFPNFRLLRTLHTTCRVHKYSQKDVFGLVNSRLLAIIVERDQYCPYDVLCSSISWLWSLHTLIVSCSRDLEGPVEFWNMHQLKHVEFTKGRLRLHLPPPPPPPNDDSINVVILENLQTLVGVVDFRLNEGVVTRIPNLTIFDVHYEVTINREMHCLTYLQRLSKLESFRCSIKEVSGENLKRICFPQSLNQILLRDDYLYPSVELEDVLLKIGGLPFVEELTIKGGSFRRGKWETIEGQFPRLKTLELMGCGGLKKWIVSESYHFPLLQKLRLDNLMELEEIPSEIRELATLKSILVHFCSKAAVLSAKKIVEEREDLYGEDELSFRVVILEGDTPLSSLVSPNFQVN